MIFKGVSATITSVDFIRRGLFMQILITLSVALFAGLMLSRLAKKVKLPAVTAYLVAGVLIGPYFLGALGFKGLGFL